MKISQSLMLTKPSVAQHLGVHTASTGGTVCARVCVWGEGRCSGSMHIELRSNLNAMQRTPSGSCSAAAAVF
jgi:hypothetical protein